MKLKNLMIVAMYASGGSCVYAQSFEKMIETVGVTLRPGMHAVQAAKSADQIAFVAVMDAEQGGPIRAGDRVFHSYYKAGRVVKVLTDGIAKVHFDDDGFWFGDRDIPVADMGRGVECYKGLCRNSRVIDPRYGDGRVQEVFSNETAKVFFAKWGLPKYRAIEDMGKGFGCYEGRSFRTRNCGEEVKK